jgi:uncharacterized protein (DUF362 family)
LPTERLCDVLVQADYVINLPIMKGHEAGVSLGFKNHFGCISNPGALHDYIIPGASAYRADYSPLVDLYRNPNIANKTALTVGDGLFGAYMWSNPPQTWRTFGDQAPCSLFFAADPVAIDCVMHDLLVAEFANLKPEANDYLQLAELAGLGLFEQGSPSGSGYQHIDYQRIEL